jgi:D-3-phosphoglycerate dehydrogenase
MLSTPRLTVTPHLAGASKQAAQLAADIGAADIGRFVAGERPEHLIVDPA